MRTVDRVFEICVYILAGIAVLYALCFLIHVTLPAILTRILEVAVGVGFAAVCVAGYLKFRSQGD